LNKWAKPFFTVWTGQLFSLVGSALVQFALVWWLTQQTNSATILATATMVAMLPEIVLGPFTGALVDRLNRKRVMMIADGAVALTTLGLALLFASGQIAVWHIYVAMFLRSLGGAFHWPAMQASTSLMVPEQHLARIAGVNQAVRGGVAIVAPPLGALLLDTLPMAGILSIDVVTAMIAIAPLFFVAVPQPTRSDAGQLVTLRVVWKDVIDGARYVRAWPGLLGLLGLAVLLNFFFAPAGALTPLLVKQRFGLGAFEYGYTEAALGIGVVVGGLLLGVWGGFRRRILTSLMGLSWMGVGILVVAAAPIGSFWLVLVGMTILGVMNPITNGPIQAIMQARVAPEMQGRVFMLVGSICGAMMPLSMLIAGPLSETMGIRTWYWAAGVASFVMAGVGLLSPTIMHLEDEYPVQSRETGQVSVIAE
jgi:DHA3 family macrolide efflux protein-like MFS transporter